MAPYKWYPQRAGRVDLVLDRAKQTGAIADPVVRQEIAKLLTMQRSAEWTSRRARAAQMQGKPQGPEGSLGKLASSHVARLAAKVHTMMTGADSMLSGEDAPLGGVITEILISVPAARSPAERMRFSGTSSPSGCWGCRRSRGRIMTGRSGMCRENLVV